MQRFSALLRECFPAGSRVLFASKALSYVDVYRIASSEGIGADVVSPGELYTACKAGFNTKDIYFHGNNKTDADIAYALDVGVGTFVVDNEDELLALDRIAGAHGKVQDILLRISPGIDPHTHKKVVTGSVDSKFGTAIETGQAMALVERALALSGVRLKGFHCHIGSQIFDSAPFIEAAEVMLAFIADVYRKTGSSPTKTRECWCIPTHRGARTRSSTTSRPTSTAKANTTRAPSMRSHPRSATASTATPAGWSSRRKTRRRCAR